MLMEKGFDLPHEMVGPDCFEATPWAHFDCETCQQNARSKGSSTGRTPLSWPLSHRFHGSPRGMKSLLPPVGQLPTLQPEKSRSPKLVSGPC